MNSLLLWLTSPAWALVVKALLHSLWQGALIAGALVLLLRHVANPASRYRLALSPRARRTGRGNHSHGRHVGRFERAQGTRSHGFANARS